MSTLNGSNHLKIDAKKATELPKTLDNEIRNAGAQHANPVRKLGRIPIIPLYL